MKARIEAEHAGDPERFHVKLGAGGIRDVEFVAQTFQLLHGGRIPQVRGRSAPGALDSLAQVGVISGEMRNELLRAYRFLRRLENRLQMLDERQTHRLPAAGPGRERLARTLYPAPNAVEQLEDRLRNETVRVRAHFEATLASGDADGVADLIDRAAPQLMKPGPARQPLEELARRLGRAVSESADPERAMNNLARFVEGVGARSFYYGLLMDRPELVPRLVGLFANSRYLSNVVAKLPQLIAPLFADPAHLIPSRKEWEEGLGALRREREAEGIDVEEAGLAALRLFQQRELVNVGLLDLAGTIDLDAVEAALTELAEVCLSAALGLARAQLERSRPEAAAHVADGEFLVIGMGKLGSRELGYGSDLDVIFLYDAPDASGAQQMEAQDAFVRLAQKLGWALQTPTPEGVCYEVDARLRPSGNQGMLVTSFAGFERYHAESAMVWERQALLRARPVAGSAALGERFAALRDAILRKPLPEDLREQVHHVRARMEQELAQEGPGQRNLKTGRGGVLDVESIVQLLQLQHGAQHPELLEAQPVATLLEGMSDAGLLPPESVTILREGWEFLRRLSSRLRIVENRSIHDLREDRSDLDSVARSLGYAPSARTGTSRLPLLDEYTRRTESIRTLYTQLVGEDEKADVP
jgi:glutamate-ammonia-ligase adenylyltransferase